MQRVAPFLLALIFLLVSAGYYLAFLSEDVALKSDAQQVINSAEQQRVQVALTFTPGTQAAVHFTNARQTEFIYGGMHYDVVRKFFIQFIGNLRVLRRHARIPGSAISLTDRTMKARRHLLHKKFNSNQLIGYFIL